MLAHHLADGFSTFTAIVKGDAGHKVMENVSLDNVMEDVLADKAKVSINGGRGSTGKVPLTSRVMGQTGVSVLEISNVH